MLISNAFAQEVAGAAAEASPIAGMIPFLAIIVIFYFLMIRPQTKKMKAHQAMVAAVARGDEVVTAGGLVGKVSKVGEDGILQVDIANGVTVQVVQHTLTDVRPKNSGKKAEIIEAQTSNKKAGNTVPSSIRKKLRTTTSSLAFAGHFAYH